MHILSSRWSAPALAVVGLVFAACGGSVTSVEPVDPGVRLDPAHAAFLVGIQKSF
jgi:hypothetical protein